MMSLSWFARAPLEPRHASISEEDEAEKSASGGDRRDLLDECRAGGEAMHGS
jgi:hypothetical protein